MDQSAAIITSSYDEVPYESHPFPQSHPDRLATLGRIFGMTPAPVVKCRVLELGCASGGNIIPLACQLPESSFVGVDLSLKQVATGREIIRDLALNNIELRHASILDVDHSWGLFDYIICHGVFSWVPANVREKILAISAANLAPMGVAYVSYNTYPGWHMREMIRRMMLYHSEQFSHIPQKIQQARALIEFLSNSVPTENNPYGMFLKSELELIKKSKDYYLFHDHLEEVNTPLYFHQFAEQAAAQGLQYLGEAEFGTMLASGFQKDVAETLQRISPNIINTEQYMDFLRNRFFRQTLLCHKDVQLKRALGPESVMDLMVASSAQATVTPIDFSLADKVSFRTPAGASVETNRPLTKAALVVLREAWPRSIAMDELLEQAHQKLGVKDYHRQQMKLILAADLLQCYSARVVEFHTWQPDYFISVSDKPKANPLSAYLGKKGHNQTVNSCHEVTALDVVGQNLIGLLDGTRDRAALLEHLRQLTAKGVLSINQDGKPVTDRIVIDNSLRQALEATLANMARSALLVG